MIGKAVPVQIDASGQSIPLEAAAWLSALAYQCKGKSAEDPVIAQSLCAYIASGEYLREQGIFRK